MRRFKLHERPRVWRVLKRSRQFRRVGLRIGLEKDRLEKEGLDGVKWDPGNAFSLRPGFDAWQRVLDVKYARLLGESRGKVTADVSSCSLHRVGFNRFSMQRLGYLATRCIAKVGPPDETGSGKDCFE